MSDTQDHFTVEDAGSTSDAADLVNSGVGHAAPREEDPVESADEVVRATDDVPATGAAADDRGAAPAVATEYAATAAPQEATDQPASEAGSAPRQATAQQQEPPRTEEAQQEEPRQTQPMAQQDAPGAVAEAATPAPAGSAHGDLSALADADIGHVFDQTNGVIERADGDSDGSARSEELDDDRSGWPDPFIDDAAVHGAGDVPESRRTGD